MDYILSKETAERLKAAGYPQPKNSSKGDDYKAPDLSFLLNR